MDSNFISEAKQILQKNNSDVEYIQVVIEIHEKYVKANVSYEVNKIAKTFSFVGFNYFELSTFIKMAKNG
jgi:hypothetical protein